MHGSTASLRPRQRTSTSCTECRRRKQKCNQAKDRPCNNCARRYPPVVCTYDSGSSSRGSTVERAVDLQGEEGQADEGTPTSYISDSSSYAHSHHSAGNYPTTSDQYSSPSYRTPAQTSTHYWPQQDQTWNNQYAAATSHAGSYDSSSYGTVGAPVAGTTYDTGYYANTYTGYSPQGTWLSPTGDPRAFVGTGTTYDALDSLPVDPSRRNAELYHFFHQSLAPHLVTIDGKDPPDSFYKEWTPWMAQSPLLASQTLLNASSYLSDVRGLEVANNPERISLQSRIISVINDYLKKKKMREVDIEAVAAVLYLALNEWYWGNNGSFWSHMKGLKEMIRLRGGMDSMAPDSLVRKQLILTDYQIACSCEHELFLHEDPSLDTSFIALTTYPTFLESPLLPSGIRFLDIFSTFSLSIDIAEMLDDMKFLTSSIRTFQTSRDAPTTSDLAKFHSSALWAHNRILSLPSQLPSADPGLETIYETIRLAALIYSSSVLSLSPLSKSATPGQIAELGDKMWKVSLTRWKEMPGILLWVVLVVAAAASAEEEKRHKKFAERMIQPVAMFVGVQNQEVAVNLMHAFLGVQRWVGGRDERAFEGVGKGKAKSALDVPVLGGDDMHSVETTVGVSEREEGEGDGLGGILGGLGGAVALSKGQGKPRFPKRADSGD